MLIIVSKTISNSVPKNSWSTEKNSPKHHGLITKERVNVSAGGGGGWEGDGPCPGRNIETSKGKKSVIRGVFVSVFN